MGFGSNDQFVFVVDAPCAVTDVFKGTITCSADTSNAKVVAVRREDSLPSGTAPVAYFDLPSQIRTVENSPSASDYNIVLANYSGYGPDPTVKGVVSVYWDPASKSFKQRWFNDAIQMNGIVSQSRGSNLAYSSGTASDGTYHFYGIRIFNDANGPGGAVVVDKQVADAATVNSAFDAGNQAVINDDRSVVWSTGEGIVRIVQG